MRNAFDRIGRRILFAFDPETAHGLSIMALRSRLRFSPVIGPLARLRTHVAGLEFPNPLGLAAGYDKNAEVPDALLAMGFGFAECGTVTPRPQPGNAGPRLFRLESDGAVINRLGFNNGGHAAFERRLRARAGKAGIVGANIGTNADSADRVSDYEAGVRRFAALASYLTINISSPNTAGLRTLQTREKLAELLSRVVAARNEACAATRVTPLFVKIAPDLDDGELADIADLALEHRLDGLVVSNTTLARDHLTAARASEPGGLSGAPLFVRSTVVLARTRRFCGPKLAIIGVGGVDSAETALEKIRAGADLIQLYTGMIYRGPSLPGRIVRAMDDFAREEGLERLAEIRDSRMEYWADRKDV